jgi:FkbM family methyltransferase
MQRSLFVNQRTFELFGDPQDSYFQNVSFEDQSEGFISHIAKNHIRSGAVIFDIGANVGATVAAMTAYIPECRIYAFEPSRLNFEYLSNMIAHNQLANCQAFQLALGSTAGEVDFLANLDSGSASHLSFEGVTLGGANERVLLKTVDQVVSELKLDRLDFVKIDVEGFESDVLLGAEAAIARLRPSMFVEFNAFTLIAYGDKNPRRFLEQLMDTFAHVYRFQGDHLEEIVGAGGMLGFIHDNITKAGCVDDLFCTFKKAG